MRRTSAIFALSLGCTSPPKGLRRTGPGHVADTASQVDDSASSDDSGAFVPPMRRTCGPLHIELHQEMSGLFGDISLALARDALPGPGLAVGDLDGDGTTDAVLARPGAPALLLLGDGSRFAVAGELPEAEVVALADLDGDGDLDVVLAGSGEDVWLRSTPSGFAAEALPQAGRHTASVAPFDADADGDVDLFVARHAWPADFDRLERGDWPGDGHALLLNDGAGGFTVADDEMGEAARGLGFHGAPVDVDQDGDLDIYLNHDFGPHAGENRVLLNDGEGRLVPRSGDGADIAVFAMGTSVSDITGDGFPDLFVGNLRQPAMLASLGDGTFAEAGAAMGLASIHAPDRNASWGSRFVDVDGDGDDDLVVGFSAVPAELGSDEATTARTEQRDLVLLQVAGPEFLDAEVAGVGLSDFARAHGTKVVLTADLDASGRPELLTLGYTPDYDDLVLRVWTLSGGCGSGLTVRLPLDAQNIGARVDVVVDGVAARRWMLPSGLYGASAGEVYLGLGEAGYASDVEVRTLAGRTHGWTNVVAGSVLVVD